MGGISINKDILRVNKSREDFTLEIRKKTTNQNVRIIINFFRITESTKRVIKK